jgi:hypothetical protein
LFLIRQAGRGAIAVAVAVLAAGAAEATPPQKPGDSHKVRDALNEGADKVGSALKTGAEKVGPVIDKGVDATKRAVGKATEAVGSTLQETGRRINEKAGNKPKEGGAQDKGAAK